MFNSDCTRWWQQCFMRSGLSKSRRRSDRAWDLDCAAWVETYEARLLLASTLDVRVSAAADDVEESASGGLNFNSSDLELVSESTLQTVGLRFNGVTIPQGATITNAFLQFQTDQASSEATSLVIQGEKSGDAAAFADVNGNVSSRPRTAAAVSWEPDPWLSRGEAGPAQQTSDIQAVIQEIVNQSSWSSGNSLAIIITGAGKRVADSFDGDSAGAPLLHVEYTALPNDPPVVTPATFSLDEHTANGTTVGTAIANDPDGHNITFSLSAGNTGDAFAIHPTSGEITVNNAANVDFEATPQFQLTVTATDDGPGNRSGSATVTVDLLDLDDAPVVQPATFSVLEGSADDTLVGTVTAGQIDAGQSVTFAITAGDTGGVFDIDTATGQITVVNAAQLGAASTSYALTVEATDNTPGMLSGSATITIVVASASETLEVRVGAGTDDAEEDTGGSMDINSSDLELVAEKTLQTVGLRFNGVTIPQGATITGASLQFQTNEANAEATSLVIQGEKSGDAAGFVSANGNVSSRPRTDAAVSWEPDPWLTVGEAGPAQQTSDIQAVIQEIVNQSGWSSGNSLAVIITGTGKRVADSFNGNPAGAPLLHIEYTVIPNDPPVVTPDTFSLDEHSTNGTAVGTAIANDPDGHNITFSLTAGNTGDAFAIHPTSGEITVNDAAHVDFEATPQFQLTVTATDDGPGNRSGSATVTVDLLDLDEAPMVQPATFAVPEGSGDGTLVGTAAVDQIDAGQSVAFAITAGDSNGVFDIDTATGQITVVNAAQLGAASTSYALTVQATDNTPEMLSGSATVTIDVTDGTSGGTPETLEVRVGAADDDVEESATGSLNFNSSDLEMVNEKTLQTVGLRFNGVTIPQGATITGASLQFQADETNSEATSLVIQGEKSGDAAAFAGVNGNVSSRPRTDAAVSWEPDPWLSRGDAGPAQQTSDIQAVIQEIVNQPGWSSGNSLAIIITGAGKRVAESFDGDQAGAPLLHVEYNLLPNNPPVAQANTVSTGEDTAYSFQVDDFTFSDPEDHALVSVTITNQSLGGGTLQHNGGTPVNNGETLTAVQLATLVYTPPAGVLGTPLATFDFTVNDADPGFVSAQMDINVTPVNDPPVAIANTVSTAEDSAYSFQVGDFPFSDAEGDPLASVTITNLSLAGGTLVRSGGVAVNNGDTLDSTQLATLVYTPAANAAGSPLATFDFTVNDADPGVVSAQMGVEVTPVNDPPAALASTVSTIVDNAYPFQAGDFLFADPEGDALSSVTITNQSLGGGTLVHSGGTPVSNGNTLDSAQLATLVYTPPAGTLGAPLATFDFTVNDAAPGVVAAQMGIHVTPENSPPVAIASSVSTGEDSAYSFQEGDFDFSDSDGHALVSVTITNQNLGGGTLVHNGGTAVNDGDTLSAGQLGTLVYTPPASTAGAPLATFDFTVNDADAGVVSAPMDIYVIANPSVEVTYRVNAGGSGLSGTPVWAEDTQANPSPFHTSGSNVSSSSQAIDLSHGSIPEGTPEALFQTERWDPPGGNPLEWNFPVDPGDYEVRLYFAETWTGGHAVGARTFDVSIEGVQVLNDYDVFATVGAWTGVVESFIVSSDSNLDIDFAHVVQNPAIKGLEILTIGGGNAPPVAFANTVSTIEDSAYLFSVSDFPFGDLEGDPLASVTISNQSLAGGTLQYNGGAPVNNGQTLDPSQLATLVYTPTVDAFGSPVATFDFTVNDAAPGVVAAQMAIDVTPENDSPVALANTVSTVENNAYSFNVSDFSFSDAESDPLASATITNQSLGGGTLVHSSGTPVSDGATLTAAQLATLVYTPPAATVGAPLATFEFTVNDADAGVVSAQMSIHVTIFNDPPVAIANTVSTTEDIAYSFQVGDFPFSDPEGDALQSVTITNQNLAGGTLQYGGSTTVNNGQTLTAAQLATLVYTPPANAFGSPLATFDFTVNDADPGVVSAQLSMNVTPVNDPPLALANTVGTDEDIAYSFQMSDFTFSDAEDDALASVTITNLSLSGGTLQYNGGTAVNNGDMLIPAQLDTLVYTPPASTSGTPLATFDFTVNDAADAGVVSAQMSIHVTPVNDPPVAIANTVSTPEDNAYLFNVVDFSFSDLEGDALQSVTITNQNLAGGTLQHSGGAAVNNGQTLDPSQLATLVYTPPANAFGSPLASFDFTVNDAGLGTESAQMGIEVTPVNDAPVALASTVSTPEDTAYQCQVGDFAFSDVEGDPLMSVMITNQSLAGGTLQYNGGTTVNNGDMLTAAELATLVYMPPQDASGAPLATLDFTVNDAALGVVSAQMDIQVTPLNDPPVVTPDQFTVVEFSPNGAVVGAAMAEDPDGDNVTYSITAGDPNGVFDIDANTGQITVVNAAQLGGPSTSYALTVQATDDTPDMLSGSATISIFVISAAETLEVRVNAADDDAEEDASGSMDLGSSDLELVTDGGVQTVGLRFNGVTIPQGAIITGASVQFQTDEVDSVATSLLIQGEKSDNAQTFASVNGNVSSRPRTTAAVSWAPAPWLTVGEAGPAQQTSDIQEVIQEIVDQSGWSSGNSLAIIITGTGKRVAESFNGNQPAAPLLHVEYTVVPNDPPVVTPDTFSLDEHEANGTAVGTVVANDPEGQNITFTITAGNTGSAFAIHPTSGVITVNDATQLDFEVTSQFLLTVTATDDGPGTRSGAATVTVNLVDLEEAPIVDPAMFSVLEGSPNGTLVGTATASQIDTGQTVSFSITGGDPSGVFDIDAASGEITVVNAAQLGVGTTEYLLTVQATDNTPEMLFGSATVTIGIPQPVIFRAFGDTPYDETEYDLIAEELTTFSPIDEFLIHVGDTKSASTACTEDRYSRVHDVLVESPIPVFIVPGDNELTDCSDEAQAWDFWNTYFGELDQNFSNNNFNVLRQAPAGQNGNENFAFVHNSVLFIGIHIVGGSQLFGEPQMIQISEWVEQNFNDFGDEVTSAVLFAQAFPEPSGTRQIFHDAFVQHAQSFEKPILYVMGDKHSWLVDQPFPEAQNVTRLIVDGDPTTSRITVTHDPNEPFLLERFPNDTIRSLSDADGAANVVAEGAAAGTPVGVTAQAVDPDASDSVSYSLDDDAGGRFAIDSGSGVVDVANGGLLDYETATEHTITVRATSTDGSSTTTEITIAVSDTNDTPPVIDAGQTFAVDENAPVGTVVGTLSAGDDDTVGSLQNWSLIAGNEDGVFALDALTGELRVADNTLLDFQTTPAYTLTVTVEDGVNTSTPQTVTINVNPS